MTRHPIESRQLRTASVSSAEVAELLPRGVRFRTWAQPGQKRAISSADLAPGPAAPPAARPPVPGELRVEAVSDNLFRIRYAEEDRPPVPTRSLVVGRPPPPTHCRAETGDGRTTLATATHRAVLQHATGRLEIFQADGSLVCGIGGPEKGNFRAWDSHNTGVCRTEPEGVPLAVENFDLGPGECIYGFGEKFIGLDKVGQTIDLIMHDALGVHSPRSYKNVPFFCSTRGYGVFFDHHCLMTCWVGSLSAVDVQVALADDFLDYYVFCGQPAEVLAGYTELTGRSPVPPDWSFGLWQSKATYLSAEETLEVARQMRAHQLPADVLNVDTAWFERDWLCGLEFGPSFPDPSGWLRQMAELGFKISLWQTPNLPEGTPLFREIAEVGGFVRHPAGGIYDVGICFTPGFRGVVGVIDFTNPRAVAIYQDYLRRLFRLGVRVIKTDFGEQAPIDGCYHDGTPGWRMRNLYPLLYNEAVAAVARAETGSTLVWSRSAWAGSQQFPVHWGGDSSPLWSNLAPQIAGGLSLGLCGFTFWSHDIGGFFGEKRDEALLLRWLQAGLFCSHPRIHGMGPQELYRFSPETLRLGRDLLRLRYRLLPYVWSQARHAAARGLPLLRALVLEFPDDPNVWRLADQFLFGDSFLVAPLCDPSGRRRLYLPQGTWTDWWTGQAVAGGRWLEVSHSLETFPLFLREGSVIPLGPERLCIDDRPVEDLEFVVTPLPADGSRTLEVWTGAASLPVTYRRREGRHQLLVPASGPRVSARGPANGPEVEVLALP